ncbi:MAG TPA: ABC transporter substrate-binding protein [Acidimicrobiia bacterium]|jgi:ABC-type branched-subunit amino acid transport system substrate-binding protein|nr:ABC transporter substrate-binding protein [Acidimicrobiia bacterium]
MGSTSVRERIAIVFMTLSVVATLVLGGALAAQLGHPRDQVVQVGAASATSPDGGVTAGDQATAGVGGGETTDTTAAAAAGGAGGAAGGGSAGTAPAAGGQASPGQATSSASGAAAGRAGASGKTGAAAGKTTGTTRAGSGPAPGAATPAPSPGGAGVKGPDSPEEGVTSDAITVGGIFDETGAVDATVERDTVRAYFNQVNAAGGINGRKLQLLDCDSAFDPSRAHQCSQRLLSQKILAMVGWTSPSGEEPETKFLTGQGVPVIGGLSVNAQFNSPLAFPTMASLSLHGTAMGKRAKALNLESPGIIIVNLNFIAPMQDALLKSLHEQGIKEVAVEQVDATKADYSDIIVKMRAAGAKSILGALDPFSYARMYQAMERQNLKVPVLGFGLDKKSANDAYGGAVYGSDSLIPFKEAFDPAFAKDPDVAEYFSAVQRYFPNQVKALDVYTEAQWVAAKVFVEGLKRIQGPINRQSLVAALNTLKNFQPGLVPSISYAPGNHDPNRCFSWIKNDKGTWKTYDQQQCF